MGMPSSAGMALAVAATTLPMSPCADAHNALIAERFLLCEDAQSELNRMVANGLARGVPAALSADVILAVETFPHCQMSRAGRSDHFK